MSSSTKPRTAARGGRGVPGLAAQSAVAGVLAYVFFSVVTRALGAELAAPVSVLWTFWAAAGAALTFPLQHWITRTVVVRGGEGQVRGGLGRLLTGCVVLAAATVILAWSARDLLFGRGDAAFPLMAGGVVLGSGLLGLLRGALAARGRLPALGLTLVTENLLRCLVAAALAVGGVRDPVAYALALLAGFAVVLPWAGSLRFARGVTRPGGGAGEAIRFLTGVAAAQAMAQLVLTGGPVVLALLAAPAVAVTGLFSTLALLRAPYMLAVGVAPALTRVTAARVPESGRGGVGRWILGGLALTLATSAVAAPLGALLGPALVELVFGPSARLPGTETGVVAVGTVLALGTLALTSVVMGLGPASRAAQSWSAAAAAGLLWFVAVPLPPLERVVWTFAVTELVAFLVLGVLAWRASRHARDAHGG